MHVSNRSSLDEQRVEVCLLSLKRPAVITGLDRFFRSLIGSYVQKLVGGSRDADAEKRLSSNASISLWKGSSAHQNVRASSLHFPIYAVNLSKNTNLVPKLQCRGVVLESLQQAHQTLGIFEFLLARHGSHRAR